MKSYICSRNQSRGPTESPYLPTRLSVHQDGHPCTFINVLPLSPLSSAGWRPRPGWLCCRGASLGSTPGSVGPWSKQRRNWRERDASVNRGGPLRTAQYGLHTFCMCSHHSITFWTLLKGSAALHASRLCGWRGKMMPVNQIITHHGVMVCEVCVQVLSCVTLFSPYIQRTFQMSQNS